MPVTPNGRPGDTSSLARPGYSGPRRLSDYERMIAHALIRKGMSKSKAIGMARGLLKKAAATGRWGDHGKAGAKTRAGAVASIAQRKDFSNVDLAFDPNQPRDQRGRWAKTLYRGEGDHSVPSYYPKTGPDALTGAWWTDDPEKARQYAKGGKVYRLDVEAGEYEPRGARGNFVVLDPAVRKRRKEYVGVKKAAAPQTLANRGADLAFDPNQPRDERGRWTKTALSGFKVDITPDERGKGSIRVTDSKGRRIGTLNWYKDTGQIGYVETREGYQRRGIAKAMVERARAVDPKVHHSSNLSAAGRKFAKATPEFDFPDSPAERLLQADRALAEGKEVTLGSDTNVGAFLEGLAAYAKKHPDANLDLGKVRQIGTSLFTRDNRGIDREDMPQLSGVPIPGSKADAIPHKPGGEVDLVDQFKAKLKAYGVKVVEREVKPESLKATQDQLVGPKVAGIMEFMATAPPDHTVFEPIFVTKDHYVIDGHHRWAANVGLDALKGVTDRKMKVRMVDLTIDEALAAANRFMDEWGLPRAGFENKSTISNFSTSHGVKHRLVDLSSARYVRTPAGVKKYGQPIGTRIVADGLGGVGDTLEDTLRNAAVAMKRKKVLEWVEKHPAGLDPTGDLPGVAPLIKSQKGSDHGGPGTKGAPKYLQRQGSFGVKKADPPEAPVTSWPANPKTIRINGDDLTLDEATKVVGKAYQWPDADKEGGVLELPGAKESIRQQHHAQLVSKSWSMSTDNFSPENRQLAASVWEEYQSPTYYGDINYLLRHRKDHPDWTVDSYGDTTPEKMFGIVNDMFRLGGYTTEKPMTTYRALKSDNKDWAEELKPGIEFTDDGIVSTTAHLRFSQGWLGNTKTGKDERTQKANDVVMEIRVPEGTRIVGGDPQFIETMLPPGSRFRVKEAYPLEAKAIDPLNHAHHTFTYTHVIAELIA